VQNVLPNLVQVQVAEGQVFLFTFLRLCGLVQSTQPLLLWRQLWGPVCWWLLLLLLLDVLLLLLLRCCRCRKGTQRLLRLLQLLQVLQLLDLETVEWHACGLRLLQLLQRCILLLLLQ
jgi:hypothetical protein